MTKRTLLSAALLAFIGALAGCDSPGFKSKAKSPQSPGAPMQGMNGSETSLTAAPLDLSKEPVVFTQGLAISNAIAQACGIAPKAAPNGQQRVEARFDYDSAALDQVDRELLAEISKCLTTGALKGRNVSLIGRCDPRGEQEYNMTLGVSRADAVKRYMVDLGVGREHLRSTSRGELDAVGTNEDGWAKDRRVDIELAL